MPTQESSSASMSVLVADDESSIRFVIREVLEADGHTVAEASDGETAIQMLLSTHFDLAFLDIRMPGQTGLEVLDQVRRHGLRYTDCHYYCPEHHGQRCGSDETGSSRLPDQTLLPRAGHRAHGANPESPIAPKRGQRTASGVRVRMPSPLGQKLIGSSPALLEIFKTVGKVAVRNVPVLILGESGTGKELVAHAIHVRQALDLRDPSSQSMRLRFLGNCWRANSSAMNEAPLRARCLRDLDDSARPQGGTLFLDEIGDMPITLQAKLLRALQSGEVIPVGGRDPYSCRCPSDYGHPSKPRRSSGDGALPRRSALPTPRRTH